MSIYLGSGRGNLETGDGGDGGLGSDGPAPGDDCGPRFGYLYDPRLVDSLHDDGEGTIERGASTATSRPLLLDRPGKPRGGVNIAPWSQDVEQISLKWARTLQ